MRTATNWSLSPTDDTQVRRFLTLLAGNPVLHARFLNTLSLLEHIGSRKIMACHARIQPTQDTLRHLAEETRHAYFFKRAAKTVGQKDLSYSETDILAGPQTRAYMGRLDARISKAAPGPAAYYYMSLLVELRAIWFYTVYQSVLQQTGQTLNLGGLLAEETRHLDEMGTHLEAMGEDVEARLPAFIAHEQACFATLFTALERALSQADLVT